MPKKKSKSRKKRPRRPKIKHPHTGDKLKRARRRYAKPRHPRSKIDHSARVRQDVEGLNYLLHQLLKTASSTDENPYHYHPRHHTRDPEYRWETRPRQRFKRGFPAPDVSMLRPQHKSLPPHLGNYPLGAIAHRR